MDAKTVAAFVGSAPAVNARKFGEVFIVIVTIAFAVPSIAGEVLRQFGTNLYNVAAWPSTPVPMLDYTVSLSSDWQPGGPATLSGSAIGTRSGNTVEFRNFPYDPKYFTKTKTSLGVVPIQQLYCKALFVQCRTNYTMEGQFASTYEVFDCGTPVTNRAATVANDQWQILPTERVYAIYPIKNLGEQTQLCEITPRNNQADNHVMISGRTGRPISAPVKTVIVSNFTPLENEQWKKTETITAKYVGESPIPGTQYPKYPSYVCANQ